MDGQFLRVEPGINYEWLYELTGVATEGDTITFNDSVNGAKVITWRDKPVMSVAFTTGAPADNAELTVWPLGSTKKARIIFLAAAPANQDPGSQIFWVNTTTNNSATLAAQAFKTIVDGLFGSSGTWVANAATTSGAGATITVTDAAFGSGAALVVEVADSSNRIAITATKPGTTSTTTEASIGATATAGMLNLYKTMWNQVDAHTLQCVPFIPVAGAMRMRFFSTGYFAATPTLAESGTASHITSYVMPYRAMATQWEDSNVVHWVQNITGEGVPLVYADRVYGGIRIGGKWDHIRNINPTKLSHAWGCVRFGGVGSAGDRIVIDSITDASKNFTEGTEFAAGATAGGTAVNLAAAINAAGQSYQAVAVDAGAIGYVFVSDGAFGANTAFLSNTVDAGNVIDLIFASTISLSAPLVATSKLTFDFGGFGVGLNPDVTFQAGGGTDDLILGHFFINITTNNTAALQIAALKALMSGNMNTLVAAYSSGSGFLYSNVDPTGVRMQVFCNLPQAANSVLTTVTTDPGGFFGTPKPYLGGSADPTMQGYASPFVFKDCGQIVARPELHPFMTSTYTANAQDTTTDAVFADTYSAQAFYATAVLDQAFFGMNLKPIYIEKSGAGVSSRAHVQGEFFGPFGKGALTTSKVAFLNSTMVAGDVKVTGTYIDGAIV